MENEDIIFGKTKKEEDDFLFCEEETDPNCKKKRVVNTSFIDTGEDFLKEENTEKQESELSDTVNDINMNQEVTDTAKQVTDNDFMNNLDKQQIPESNVTNEDIFKQESEANQELGFNITENNNLVPENELNLEESQKLLFEETQPLDLETTPAEELQTKQTAEKEQEISENLEFNEPPIEKEPVTEKLEAESTAEKSIDEELQNADNISIEELQPAQEQKIEEEPELKEPAIEKPIIAESEPFQEQNLPIEESATPKQEPTQQEKFEEQIFDKTSEQSIFNENKANISPQPIKEEHSFITPEQSKTLSLKAEENEEKTEDLEAEDKQCEFNLSDEILTDLETVNADFLPEFEAQRAKEEEEAKKNSGETDEQSEQDVELKPIEDTEKLNDIFSLNLENIEDFLKKNVKEKNIEEEKGQIIEESKKKNEELKVEEKDKEEVEKEKQKEDKKDEIKEMKEKEEKKEKREKEEKESNKEDNKNIQSGDKTMPIDIPTNIANKKSTNYSFLDNFELNENLWKELNLPNETKEQIKNIIKLEIKSFLGENIIPLLEKVIK